MNEWQATHPWAFTPASPRATSAEASSAAIGGSGALLAVAAPPGSGMSILMAVSCSSFGFTSAPPISPAPENAIPANSTAAKALFSSRLSMPNPLPKPTATHATGATLHAAPGSRYPVMMKLGKTPPLSRGGAHVLTALWTPSAARGKSLDIAAPNSGL